MGLNSKFRNHVHLLIFFFQPEGAALQLGTSSKNVRSAMAQLQTAAAQQNDNYTGHAAQETAHSLKDLTSAVRGVAATTNDRQLQTRIIQSADSVMDKSLILIEEARHSLLSHEKITTQDLINISKEVSAALNQCVSCLPGQKDVDEVINNIDDASQILNMNEFPHTNKTYKYVFFFTVETVSKGLAFKKNFFI